MAIVRVGDLCGTANNLNESEPRNRGLFTLEDVKRQGSENKSLLQQKQNKLRGPQSASELYGLSDRHLSMKFSANFCG
jgi:hypothetical protein